MLKDFGTISDSFPERIVKMASAGAKLRVPGYKGIGK